MKKPKRPKVRFIAIVLKTFRKVEGKVHTVLETMLSRLDPSEFEKTLVIVDKNRFRIRRASA